MNTKNERLINDNQIIMLDTCFAMNDGFPKFVEGIEVDLMASNKKIIVKSVVMAELYRHMGSSDEVVKSKATRAVDTICMRRNIFSIDEDKVTTEAILKGFADVEFITDFTKSRIRYRMALLTNDYKLGKDISDLNNLESCYGKKVEVFCLGRSGDLEERLYEEDQAVVTEQVVPTTVEPKQETKKNWMPVILTSAACFAAGIVTDKYGKQIMNTIVKAIA